MHMYVYIYQWTEDGKLKTGREGDKNYQTGSETKSKTGSKTLTE